MTMDLLLTTVLILSEVIIILVGLAVFLLIRLRRHRDSPGSIKPTIQPDTTRSEVNPNDSIRDYLQTQTNLTREKIESIEDDINPQQQLALASRLSLLSHETEILNNFLNSDHSNDNDWEIIYNQYSHPDDTSDDKENYEEKFALLNSRIKKLEIFKDLFNNAQNRLKKSFDVINELKISISKLPGKEENQQIEEMVDQLSVENINLHKQIDEANLQLKNIFEEANQSIKNADGTDANNNPILDSDNEELQTENEFLTKQIQELLILDRENATTMKKRITELEAQIQDYAERMETIDELKEENEFLARQIEFLLKQELEANKTIKTLEENIEVTAKTLKELKSDNQDLTQENIDLVDEQQSIVDNEQAGVNAIDTEINPPANDIASSDNNSTQLDEAEVSDELSMPEDAEKSAESNASIGLDESAEIKEPPEVDIAIAPEKLAGTNKLKNTEKGVSPDQTNASNEPVSSTSVAEADAPEIIKK